MKIKDEFCSGVTHKWTEWFNTDTPDGNGDIETIELFKDIGCKDKSIFTQVVTAKENIDHKMTGQKVHIDKCFGFICLNQEQSNNQTCHDYKIRQCCPYNRKQIKKIRVT